MKRRYIPFFMVFFSGILSDIALTADAWGESNTINLPEPSLKGDMSVETALHKRRSIRSFRNTEVAMSDISQLLWAAQGITEDRTEFRTAPSAGALYPLEVLLIVYQSEDLDSGIYRYLPGSHQLTPVLSNSVKNALYRASGNQSPLKSCPALLIIAADFSRTTRKYGERGIRYVWMEAGHSAQNIYLQAVSLNLGTVVIGAFSDKKVQETVKLPENEHPLYLIPFGEPSR